MNAVLDLAPASTIIVVSGALIRAAWLVWRMASKIEAASARCLRELSAPNEAAHRRIGEDEIIGG
jgi:hypothetical protein